MRDILGYEGFYKIDELGRILSVERYVLCSGLILVPESWRKPILHQTGYMVINLAKNGITKTHRIHKLVAIAFITKKEGDGNVINHKNGDKTDNRACNLEWCTNLENSTHAVKMGLIRVKGCNNPSAKLTYPQIVEAKALVLSGLTLKRIGKLFSVVGTTVSKALDREFGIDWRSVQKPQYRSKRIPNSISDGCGTLI